MSRTLDFLRRTGKSVHRLDAWYNAITGLGTTARDKLVGATVGGVYPLSGEVLGALYHGDPMAARIVDAPIDHGMMLGFEIDDDPEGVISEACRNWGVGKKLSEAATWGRLYGGGAIMVGTRAGKMEDQLDVDSLPAGGLLYLAVLEARHMQPVEYYEDPEHPSFGEPRIWLISKRGRGAGIVGARVHESRLIMFGGARTSEDMRQRNGGFDLSVLQRPYEILRDTDTAWKHVMHVLGDLTQAVFKLHGLIDMVAEGEGARMQDRMEIVNMARSIARAVVIDAEHEDFAHVGAANVSGVAPIMDKVLLRLAAAVPMPVSILMGMSPAGLNATGESDMRSWFNTVQSFREQYLGPRLQTIIRLVAANEGIRSNGSHTWPSLWQMAPTEEAAYRKTVAETDAIYEGIGALLSEEIAVARWGRGTYSAETASAVDVAAREENLSE